MKKPLLPVLALLLPVVHADLVITEVMAKSAHTTPTIDGDWWELTNSGPHPVDLDGYTWDDTPAVAPDPLSISTFPPFTINPGESIIILQADQPELAAWKAAWGLGSGIRVLTKDQFNVGITNGEAFSGLSKDGDEVNLYDADGERVAQVEFGASAGKSLAFLRDGTPIYGLGSTAGRHGAVNSTQSPADTGSPGDAGIHFVSVPVAFTSASYSITFEAVKPGASAPTLFATGLPSFLTLTPGTGGTATLASNRPLTLADTGPHVIQVTASAGGSSTIQEFLLTVLNPSPTIVLNEYNAVDDTGYLNGGTGSADEDGGNSSDSHFGRVSGNGGPWVEFVVVGDGTTGSVDLRGWSIEIGKDLGSGFVKSNTLVMTNHADWQSVATGTLLTLIANNTAQGGLDSGFVLRNNRSTTGDSWTNIWMGDPSYLAYTSFLSNGYGLSFGVVNGIDIDNNGTQFIVRNAGGEAVFGPAGEGIAPRSGISATEVFALRGHATPSVSPLMDSSGRTPGYDDASSGSSFGARNQWNSGGTSITQDFSPYSTGQFSQWAAGFALRGDTALRAADPDDDGRSNLAEYAFGGDPTVRDGPYPAGPLTAGPQLQWTITRRSNDPALDFSHEASPDLLSWLPVTAISSVPAPFAGNAAFSRVTLRFDRPVPAPSHWFLRAAAE